MSKVQFTAELLALHVQIKPCRAEKRTSTVSLSRYEYATAKAAGFDMSQFAIAPSRYMRC